MAKDQDEKGQCFFDSVKPYQTYINYAQIVIWEKQTFHLFKTLSDFCYSNYAFIFHLKIQYLRVLKNTLKN